MKSYKRERQKPEGSINKGFSLRVAIFWALIAMILRHKNEIVLKWHVKVGCVDLGAAWGTVGILDRSRVNQHSEKMKYQCCFSEKILDSNLSCLVVSQTIIPRDTETQINFLFHYLLN